MLWAPGSAIQQGLTLCHVRDSDSKRLRIMQMKLRPYNQTWAPTWAKEENLSLLTETLRGTRGDAARQAYHHLTEERIRLIRGWAGCEEWLHACVQNTLLAYKQLALLWAHHIDDPDRAEEFRCVMVEAQGEWEWFLEARARCG